jgi:DNA mismatch repair protein MutS2
LLLMHTAALTSLEFDRIVEVVTSLAITPLGREYLEQLTPSQDPKTVQQAQALTTETVRFLAGDGSCPLEATDLLSETIGVLAIEDQILEPAQLHALAGFLRSVERACEAVAAAGDDVPSLSMIVSGCPTWQREYADVYKKVDASGEVVDDASPDLRAVRSRLQKQRNRLRGNLESYLRGRDTAKYLQEQFFTERNGRLVLVLKSEHRTAIPGIVHGTSASGASLYLEPLSTVDVNNEIVALEEQEQKEMRRILLALAGSFRRRGTDLHHTLRVATDLDTSQARARFADLVDGTEPRLSDDSTMELREARHPLLMESVTARLSDGRKPAATAPVPVDILLKPPVRALIVTGPNTGGKTVALKTAGLLAMMAQAGLHIPAAAGSTLPVFRSVFADIGDEQSIAANLSTFSGHVTNIVDMNRRLGLPALVLLDEVGAGTDPVEGAALGRAIVEHFRSRGAHVIATTHDEALKSYGVTESGVTCAAFGFEDETFAPTYRMEYGSSGRSLALEIAERLGLDPTVIAAARQLRTEREAQLADHLAQVDEARRAVEAQQRRLDTEGADIERRLQLLADREHALQEREKASQRELQRSLDVALKTARQEVDEVVTELRARAATLEREAAARAERQAPPLSTGDAGGLRAEARAGLEAVADRVPVPLPPARATKAPRRPTAVGQHVTVSTLGVVGIVRSLQGQDAEVEVRGKRLRVAIASLTTTTAPPSRPTPTKVVVQVAPPSGSLEELNLIGCRVEEALSKAEKHLDQAMMTEHRVVRFIHGHGTGQLRRAIAGFLGAHSLVVRVSEADPKEGGAAVTVAVLKD